LASGVFWRIWRIWRGVSGGGVSGVLILVLRWVKLEKRFEAATLETKWEKHHAMDRTCF
jgi:hypothetical protein